MAYEDFTTFTELDPYDDIDVVDSENVTVTTMDRDYDAWLYKDYGAAHFATGLTHEFEAVYTTVPGNYCWVTIWALSNVIEDTDYWKNNHSQAVAAAFGGYSASKRFNLDDCEGGDLDYILVTTSTRYYCRVIWMWTGGFGEICTVYLYTDSARTVLHDSISAILPDGRTYRYLFPVCSRNSGDSYRDLSCEIDKLDLKEVVANRRRRFLVSCGA